MILKKILNRILKRTSLTRRTYLFSISACFLGVFFSNPNSAWATLNPLRFLTGLDQPSPETAYPVKTARVVLADYDLLKRDFPSLATSDDSAIDTWLLVHAGLLAKSQILEGEEAHVNTQIIADPSHPVMAFRPLYYGRALVYLIEDEGFGEGLIDAKGAGAKSPRTGSHRTGLGSLAEMIQEYAFEKLVHGIFKHSQSHFQTIETYAVLDMGFSMIERGQETPAGVVLRQAYKREGANTLGCQLFQLSDETALQVETVLRRYGVTSAGVNYLNFPESRYQNVQGSEDGVIIDFGTYMALQKFQYPLKGMSNFPLVRYLLTPGTDEYIQPDPKLQVSTHYWGIESQEFIGKGGLKEVQKVDRLAEWTTFWAQAVAQDKTGQVRKDLANFLKTLHARETRRWNQQDSEVLKSQKSGNSKSPNGIVRHHPYHLRDRY